MTPPLPEKATLSHLGLVVGGLNMAFGYFPYIDSYDVYCRIRTYVRGICTVATDNSLHRYEKHVNVKCTNLLSF